MSGHDPVGTHLKNAGIRWVIIGQQTPSRPKTSPDIKWVQQIDSQATRSRIPVFLKKNLIPLIGDAFDLKQDFPRLKVKS
jgi:hypothetical protein